jgi:hypothetical protein
MPHAPRALFTSHAACGMQALHAKRTLTDTPDARRPRPPPTLMTRHTTHFLMKLSSSSLSFFWSCAPLTMEMPLLLSKLVCAPSSHP